MKRFLFPVCLTVLWLCASSHAATSEVHFPQEHQTFFKKHCLDCHDSATQEGGVDLEALSFTIATIEQAERWQKVLNVLNSGEMPPEDSGQPDGIEKADTLEELVNELRFNIETQGLKEAKSDLQEIQPMGPDGLPLVHIEPGQYFSGDGEGRLKGNN